MATHSLELSDKSADTTPWDGSKSAARDRLNTSVDPTVFSRIGANEGAVVSTSANLKVSVPLRSFVRAAWSVFTLDVFSVGDTPLADLKDQAVTVNTNVGLLSALILTIVVPIAFDAVLQPQTNSYIQTKAPWVGQLYFVCLFITCVGYMFATLSSVYCILIVNETTSSTQTRYLLEAAKSEFLYPVKSFGLSFALMVFSNVLWLIIVTNDLNDSPDCDIHGGDVNCGHQPVAFWVTLVLSLIITCHFAYVAIMAAAKLHKTAHKFSLKQTETLAVDLDAKKVWSEMHAFLEHYGPGNAEPNLFKEFVIRRAPGDLKMGLSYRCDKLTTVLFAERMSQLLKEDHELLKGELEQLKATQPCFKAYPDELNLELASS